MDGEDKKTVILMGWRDVSAVKSQAHNKNKKKEEHKFKIGLGAIWSHLHELSETPSKAKRKSFTITRIKTYLHTQLINDYNYS